MQRNWFFIVIYYPQLFLLIEAKNVLSTNSLFWDVDLCCSSKVTVDLLAALTKLQNTVFIPRLKHLWWRVLRVTYQIVLIFICEKIFWRAYTLFFFLPFPLSQEVWILLTGNDCLKVNNHWCLIVFALWWTDATPKQTANAETYQP